MDIVVVLLRCMNELSKNIIIQYKPIIILLLMKNKDEKTIGNFHVIFYFEFEFEFE